MIITYREGEKIITTDYPKPLGHYDICDGNFPKCKECDNRNSGCSYELMHRCNIIEPGLIINYIKEELPMR